MSAQEEGWTGRFWRLVCSYLPIWVLLLAVEGILLSLAVFSLVFGSPGTDSYVIAIVDLVVVGVTTTAVLLVIWYCRNRMPGV
ncbi:MAG: hypothetical protein ABEI39_01615 [Halobacteriales archaeon]